MARGKSYSLETLFRALADPTRLRLLNLMNGCREVCVCYFVEILKTSQPKISRHLAYLRRAGIVAARREGKWMHYRLVPPPSHAGAEILERALRALEKEKRFSADRERLKLACCRPESFVSLQGAPQPLHLANSE
jgi:ArsR family transcriptional regulator